MIQIEAAALEACGGRVPVKRDLQKFVTGVRGALGLSGEVSVLLAGDSRIRELNLHFRGKDKSTDVLSFPAAHDHAQRGRLGDLAISLETALRQADECGHSLEIELKVLLLHGLLHLAGYDHETDSGEMALEESSLRKKFVLPLGLIERGDPLQGKARSSRRVSRKGASRPAAAIPSERRAGRAASPARKRVSPAAGRSRPGLSKPPVPPKLPGPKPAGKS